MHAFEIRPEGDGITVEVPADCAFVDGHFPGAPIVPGAALLQLVLAHAWSETARAVHVRRLRFSRPVRPRARLRLTMQRDGTTVQFALREGTDLVMQGTLAPPASEGSA